MKTMILGLFGLVLFGPSAAMAATSGFPCRPANVAGALTAKASVYYSISHSDGVYSSLQGVELYDQNGTLVSSLASVSSNDTFISNTGVLTSRSNSPAQIQSFEIDLDSRQGQIRFQGKTFLMDCSPRVNP